MKNSSCYFFYVIYDSLEVFRKVSTFQQIYADTGSSAFCCESQGHGAPEEPARHHSSVNTLTPGFIATFGDLRASVLKAAGHRGLSGLVTWTLWKSVALTDHRALHTAARVKGLNKASESTII